MVIDQSNNMLLGFGNQAGKSYLDRIGPLRVYFIAG
jgi:hypothetical protein